MPDENKLLSAEAFATLVKKQYPDYAHLPDQELTAKILEKYPEYSTKVMAPGVAQSREQIGKPVVKAADEHEARMALLDKRMHHASSSPTPMTSASMVFAPAASAMMLGGSKVGAAAGRKLTGGSPVGEAAGGLIGGALGAASPSAWQSGAKLIRQLRINPENAAEVAKATAEAAARGEVPARTAHLANINAVEESTRFAIQSGEGSIERQLSAKYDALGIQVPVNFMPIGQSAQVGEADILGRGLGTVPKPVGAAASDMRSRQMAALRIYQKVMPIFQDYASGSDAFNAGSARKAVDAMNKLKELKGIDFNEAQALKSAIGKNLARPGKLAKDQADSLASLRDTIVPNMETAARQQTRLNLAYKEMGVMPEGIQDEFFRFRDAQTGGSFSVPKSKFSVDAVSEEMNKLRRSIPSSTGGEAQQKQAAVMDRFTKWNPDTYSAWQDAEHQWKLFHQDFRNPGAPLKGITNLRPNSTGHTIKTVANKPGAVMDAMKRWNLLSDDFMNVLNNPNLETDAKEARLLARSSEAYFGKTKEGIEAKGEKAGTEARKAAAKEKAAGKKKLKGVAALAVGSGTLYEYLHRKGVAPLVK